MKTWFRDRALPVILFIVFPVAFGLSAPLQEKPPAAGKAAEKFEPTEVQKLKLENAQLRAGIAQRDLTAAQRAWNEAAAALKAEADAIKKENGWPDDTQFDMQTLKFTEKPPKSPEEKKEKPKP